MQVHTDLYHSFMPPLYAGTLYQGLYQVYATRAPLGFIPGRRGDRRLPLVGSVRKSGRPHRWGHFGQIPPGAGFPRSAGGGLGGLGPGLGPGLGGGLLRDVLSHETSSSRLLYDGLCRGIILLYAGAM